MRLREPVSLATAGAALAADRAFATTLRAAACIGCTRRVRRLNSSTSCSILRRRRMNRALAGGFSLRRPSIRDQRREIFAVVPCIRWPHRRQIVRHPAEICSFVEPLGERHLDRPIERQLARLHPLQCFDGVFQRKERAQEVAANRLRVISIFFASEISSSRSAAESGHLREIHADRIVRQLSAGLPAAAPRWRPPRPGLPPCAALRTGLRPVHLQAVEHVEQPVDVYRVRRLVRQERVDLVVGEMALGLGIARCPKAECGRVMRVTPPTHPVLKRVGERSIESPIAGTPAGKDWVVPDQPPMQTPCFQTPHPSVGEEPAWTLAANPCKVIAELRVSPVRQRRWNSILRSSGCVRSLVAAVEAARSGLAAEAARCSPLCTGRRRSRPANSSPARRRSSSSAGRRWRLAGVVQPQGEAQNCRATGDATCSSPMCSRIGSSALGSCRISSMSSRSTPRRVLDRAPLGAPAAIRREPRPASARALPLRLEPRGVAAILRRRRTAAISAPLAARHQRRSTPPSRAECGGSVARIASTACERAVGIGAWNQSVGHGSNLMLEGVHRLFEQPAECRFLATK